jgi:hypothetical protein
MNCVDGGANAATAQTQPLRGPSEMNVILRISTADDHSKNSHLCEANYQLLVSSRNDAPLVVDLITSDDDYDRSLSVRANGFSQDGKLILGILEEGGPHPSTALFVYDTASHATQLIDLRQRFARVVPKTCNASFLVVGTAGAGRIVIESESDKPCAPKSRWLMNVSSNNVDALPSNASIQNLYRSGSDNR